MGKKHRNKRKLIKKLSREAPPGWFENEFGELQKRMSKAEARKRALERWHMFRMAEQDIIDAVSKKAIEEICQIEDDRILEEIEKAVMYGSYSSAIRISL